MVRLCMEQRFGKPIQFSNQPCWDDLKDFGNLFHGHPPKISIRRSRICGRSKSPAFQSASSSAISPYARCSVTKASRPSSHLIAPEPRLESVPARAVITMMRRINCAATANKMCAVWPWRGVWRLVVDKPSRDARSFAACAGAVPRSHIILRQPGVISG